MYSTALPAPADAVPCAAFERNIRDQLARSPEGGGFDPARDIYAITVNRWPHGYAYTHNSLYEPMEWVYTSTSAAKPATLQ